MKNLVNCGKCRIIVTIITVLILISLTPILMVSGEGYTYSVVEVWSGKVASTFAGGDGTDVNPYQIENGEQLALLATKVNAGDALYVDRHYVMTREIVLNDITGYEKWSETPPKNKWTAIGTESEGSEFRGVFDGAGYTISGLYQKEEKQGQGLFGYVSRATLANVGIVKSHMESTGNLVGGIVGSAYSTTITKTYIYKSTIKGAKSVGGIVGTATTGTVVKNSYNAGNVNGSDNSIGGLVGSNGLSCSVVNSYNIGEIVGESEVGGIVGKNSGMITNSYNAGLFAGANNAGSIAGSNGLATIKLQNCYYLEDENEQNTRVIGNNIGDMSLVYGFNQTQELSAVVTILGKEYKRLCEALIAWQITQNTGEYNSWEEKGEYPRLVGVGIVEDTKYKLELDVNGGKYDNETDLENKTNIYEIGQVIGELPTPSKENYEFDGWYIDGIMLDMDMVWNYETDKTAVAKWIGADYEILYYDLNGLSFSGEMESLPKSHTYGKTTVLLPANKEYYEFCGWYVDGEGRQEIAKLGAEDYTSDISLYAKWLLKTPTVSIASGYEAVYDGQAHELIATVTDCAVTVKIHYEWYKVDDKNSEVTMNNGEQFMRQK